jgi:surface antigen
MILPITGNATINQNILPVTLTGEVQPETKEPTKYIVKEGDNLTKIAEQYNTTWTRLWSKNTSLNNQDVLNVGDTIIIPNADETIADRPLYTIPVQNSPQVARNAPQSDSTSNLYEYKSCTFWVKQWKPSVGNWGDAHNWGYAAQAEGWTVSDTPVIGAIAWTTRGDYGHVGLVVGLGDGTIILKEGNFDWNGSVRTIEVPVGTYRYIF